MTTQNLSEEEINKIYDDAYTEMNQYIANLAQELNVSEGAAHNIHYLRSRSRWTQEKENCLIKLDQNQKPHPFMMDDFDHKEELRKAGL